MQLTLSSRTVVANSEPLTLAAAKLHLRVGATANTQDELINAHRVTAREQCEAFTRRGLVEGAWTFKGDAFPWCGSLVIPVAVANVQSIVISYTDTDGQPQTYSNTQYRVITEQDGYTEIVSVFGTSFPVARAERHAVTVAVTSGAQTVADSLVSGMKLLAGHLFANREAVIVGTIAAELPRSVDSLWTPYIVYGAV